MATKTNSPKQFKVSDAVEPVEFQVGDETFYALAPDALPANILIRYTEMVQDGKLYDAHKTFFGRALVKESADRFIHRLDSTETPITLSVMVQVAEWLVEIYSNFNPKKS